MLCVQKVRKKMFSDIEEIMQWRHNQTMVLKTYKLLYWHNQWISDDCQP